MNNIKSLRDVITASLKDIYSAEKLTLSRLPQMIKATTSQSLKYALQSHFVECENQIKRLDLISSILNEQLTGQTCLAAKAILDRTEEVVAAVHERTDLKDLTFACLARKIKHYEIASYSAACALAETLGEDDIVDLLQTSLEEEREFEALLSRIADDEILYNVMIQEADDDSNIDESTDDTMEQITIATGYKVLSLAVGFALGIVLAGSTLRADSSSQQNHKTYSHGDEDTPRARADISTYNNSLSPEERSITVKLRNEIINNPNMSPAAKNIVIIVDDGTVTLRGVVATSAERDWIESVAKQISNYYNIDNNLNIRNS